MVGAAGSMLPCTVCHSCWLCTDASTDDYIRSTVGTLPRVGR
jgi:hypothetical protein